VQERAAWRLTIPHPNVGCGALVLGAWLVFFSGVAQPSPLRGVDSDLSATGGHQTLYAFINVDHDNWDLTTLQSIDTQFATAIDPVELGVSVVAETLKQDSYLRQVVAVTTALGTVEAVNSSQAAETANASLQNAELGSATGQSELDRTGGPRADQDRNGDGAESTTRPTQRKADSIDVEEAAVNDQPDTGGLSLRDALRSVVTKKPDAQNSTATAIAETARDISNTASDDDFVNLGDRILDSRTLGEALAAVVQPVVTAQGQGFSVLGEGQFQLETSSDVRNVSISEVSTGLSVSMPLHPDLPQPTQQRTQRVDLVVFAANFLASPMGTLASISVGILFLVWAMTKVALAIRR
jgi:hypothetical protein